MSTTDLSRTAQTLVADGRGILAADETAPTVIWRLRGAVDGIDAREPLRLSRDLVYDAGRLWRLGAVYSLSMESESVLV